MYSSFSSGESSSKPGGGTVGCAMSQVYDRLAAHLRLKLRRLGPGLHLIKKVTLEVDRSLLVGELDGDVGLPVILAVFRG